LPKNKGYLSKIEISHLHYIKIINSWNWRRFIFNN